MSMSYCRGCILLALFMQCLAITSSGVMPKLARSDPSSSSIASKALFPPVSAQKELCKFYDACQAIYQCPEDGYLIGYGKKYCEKFADQQALFSPGGVVWENCVRTCLIEELTPWCEGEKTTCYGLLALAFGSHPDCYVKCGFCEVMIEPQNIIALVKIFEMKDFYNTWDQSKHQLMSTAWRCSAKMAGDLWEGTKKAMDEAKTGAQSLFGSYFG